MMTTTTMKTRDFAAIFLISVCILSLLPVALSRKYNIEVETSIQGRETIVRTGAQGNRTLSFKTGDTLKIQFCLRKNSTVIVSNILYSNDGGTDTVGVYLDSNKVGTFSSTSNSNFGQNWNVFVDSTQIGSGLEFWPGRHILMLQFESTDSYGIEIDAIELTVDDAGLEDNFLYCSAVCDDEITYKKLKAKDTIPSAELVQKSFRTICGEDKNINYQLFHKSVTDFKITATPPKYRTLLNDDTMDTSGCEAKSDVIWEFSDFDVSSNEASITISNAVMTFGAESTAKYTTINFDFSVEEYATRLSNEDVGSVITLEFKTPTTSFSPFTVVMERSSRTGTVTNISPSSTDDETLTWIVSDFSWIKNANNNVKLIVSTPVGTTAQVKKLKMERRPKKSNVEVTIHSDIQTKIIAVTEDQWWQDPSSMTVSLKNTEHTFQKVTRISVFKAIYFEDGFEEIFQLYQDGTTKINAMVPYGVNKIPFGSSFIIGQFSSSDKRPYAQIATVNVDALALKFQVTYTDGGTATFEVNAMRQDTEVHITSAVYAKDRAQFPIAGVRATWVDDGNSDLDRVSANLNEPHGVINNGWQKLYGTGFAFFRQCVSMHHTQGPDLLLELLNA